MSIITSQQITKYYELYREIEVTFNKNVIRATGLETANIYLKCMGRQWPCVLYATSLKGAKVIAGLKTEHFEILKKANNLVNLRFSFKRDEKTEPISFFVSSKATAFSKYNEKNPDVYFISLTYTQRPPDDLIEIIGKLIEANLDAKKRRDERVIINPESIRKLGLASKETFIYIEAVPRKCILRDISYSGAKVLIFGIGKFLMNKKAILKIPFEDRREPIELEGTVVRFEEVEGRKDISAIAIQFDEGKVPMEYRMKLSDYLQHSHRT